MLQIWMPDENSTVNFRFECMAKCALLTGNI